MTNGAIERRNYSGHLLAGRLSVGGRHAPVVGWAVRFQVRSAIRQDAIIAARSHCTGIWWQLRIFGLRFPEKVGRDTLSRIIHQFVGWVRKPLCVVGQRSLTIARQQQAAIDYQLVCDDPPMTYASLTYVNNPG